ncbi:acyltransferase [Sphingomonas sp.]|jgi:peptidoglycan/LPS O-acetylase OafA/YrhL|uniref:acyltransferase family protein n=1 Tax=Sphingomonas sp. TaxID=28214 RepID=UPI002E2F878A|nr:acyltransferase [Sphingomonas sp.]HEX4693040.1 acyltransferase [Sphingomonas sp.]
MERHYGMDWLRIGAFALLILYHIGMVFVPWGFQVKTAHPMAWVDIPMLLTNPWRLTLLFVVSGYASRALATRSATIGAFVRSRNARLLPPLLFGMAVIVPPQTWVEVVTQHGYAHGFWRFWTQDYFRFGTLFGIVMPTWNHLWFVVYLWVYTLALGCFALVPGADRLQRAFDIAFGGGRAIWVPLAFALVTQFWLFQRIEDTHDFFRDGIAHLQYFPAFLFGFGLAGSRAAIDGLKRWWAVSAALAILCYAIIAGMLVAWPDFGFPSHGVAQFHKFVRELDVWLAITALVGAAERFLNHDHRWRATLAEATFPFYIIHQTVIVVVEFWLKPLGIGAGAEFAVLVATTVAGCWAFYLAGRQIGWLRPWVGLKPRAARAVARYHAERPIDVRARPDVA